MKTIKTRDVEIGRGIPKICVPIVGETRRELLEEIELLKRVPCDLAEWRADYYGGSIDIDGICAMLEEIRAALDDMPLLFTFRSGNEGGAKDITGGDYRLICEKVILSGNADITDIELSCGEDAVKELVYAANKEDVYILASSHDFCATPSKETMIKRLCKMQELGADITKIAVTPQTLRDVHAVIEVMSEMVECYADRPFVAISMTGPGFVSRIIGEEFGSCITFGALRRPSAPGQVSAKDLDTLLRIMHGAG